jgi:hypothetical protein
MSIRDRVRRVLRSKSGGSSSDSDSMSQSDTSPATPTSSNTSQSSDSVQSLTSKLSRTFAFGARDKESTSTSANAAATAAKEKSKKRRSRPLHPSERPLTAQNLRHQQMLNQFTMTFGTDNLSQLDLDGVSPCCTRAPSIDGLAIAATPGFVSQMGRTSFSDDEIAPA